MLPEINLIKQKKRNVVPYVIAFLFIILLLAAILFLDWQATDLQARQDKLQSQVDENVEKQANQISVQNIHRQRETLETQVGKVEEMVFPAVDLLDQMTAYLPQDSYFANYAYSISDGLTLNVQFNELEQVARYSNTLNQQNFITNVSINTISHQGDEAGYSVALQVTIDEQGWMEVASQ